MGTATRRLTAAALAVAGALAAVTGRSLLANGATAPAAGWGTFAQLATNDLATPAARQAAAQNYDVLVLRGAIAAPLLADLRARRSDITLFTYEKAAGLSNADVKAVSAQHPEWIAKDATGAVIHPRGIADTTLGDLTNPAFRAWSAQRMAAEVGLGADGAFIDTLGAYFPASFYTARPSIDGAPVTDAAWRAGSVDLIQRVKAASGKVVVANGFGLGSGAAYYAAQAAADQLIAAADGVQIEGFTRWGDAGAGQVRKAPQWNQDLAFLASLGARGKFALAFTKVNPNAAAAVRTALRDYALGSFLAAYAPGRSYFGFDDSTHVPVTASTASWATGLGAPSGARSAVTDGWTRPFSGGVLTVKIGTPPVVS